MVLPGLDTIGRPRRRQLEQEKRAPIREAAAGKTQETSSTQSNPDLPLRSARRFLKPDTVGYDEYAATFVAAAANPLWNRSSGCLSNGSVGSNESTWHLRYLYGARKKLRCFHRGHVWNATDHNARTSHAVRHCPSRRSCRRSCPGSYSPMLRQRVNIGRHPSCKSHRYRCRPRAGRFRW